MKTRELEGVVALLEFAAGRTIERELKYREAESMCPVGADSHGGVLFTDGAALVAASYQAFAGSEVTPPDSPEVRYYCTETFRR